MTASEKAGQASSAHGPVLAVGEADERAIEGRVHPDEGPGPTEVTERRRAVARPRPVRVLAVAKLEREPPVERIEPPDAGQDAGQTREHDRRRLGEPGGRQERRAQQLAGQGRRGRAAARAAPATGARRGSCRPSRAARGPRRRSASSMVDAVAFGERARPGGRSPGSSRSAACPVEPGSSSPSNGRPVAWARRWRTVGAGRAGRLVEVDARRPRRRAGPRAPSRAWSSDAQRNDRIEVAVVATTPVGPTTAAAACVAPQPSIAARTSASRVGHGRDASRRPAPVPVGDLPA